MMNMLHVYTHNMRDGLIVSMSACSEGVVNLFVLNSHLSLGHQQCNYCELMYFEMAAQKLHQTSEDLVNIKNMYRMTC